MERLNRVGHMLIAVLCIAFMLVLAAMDRAIITQQDELSALRDSNNELSNQVSVLLWEKAQISEASMQLSVANNELNMEIDALEGELAEARVAAAAAELHASDGWSVNELVAITRVVIAESGNESFRGQQAVAQCIRDRLRSGNYGSTISEVLGAPGQFASPYSGDLSQYPSCLQAVYDVFVADKSVFDTEVIFFYNPETSAPSAKAWLETMPLIGEIGRHVFRGENRV